MYKKELNFEEFIEDTWDFVSEQVITDKEWDDNYDLIQEVTFDLFTLYQNFTEYNPNGTKRKVLTPKLCGKLIENFFNSLKTYGIVFSGSDKEF